MKKILLAWLLALLAPFSFGQSYPSPTYKNLLVNGTFNSTGLVTCSSSTTAVTWIGGSFGCNTTINAATLGGATFASPGAIGSTTPNTGAFTVLNASTGSTTPALNVNTNGAIASQTITDTGANGASLRLVGNGATTPSKFLRANSGSFQIVNDAYSASILSLSDSGALSVPSFSATATNPGLTYTGTGAGAVARNYQSKFSDSVSVKDFGAIGNGVNNDTSAFIAAITYICSTSTRPALHVPAGTYEVTNGNFTFCNGLHIWGDGPVATVIQSSSTSGDLFAANTVTGIGVHDLSIDFSSTPTSGYAIDLVTNVYNSIVENVRITHAYGAIGVQGIGVPQFFNNLDIENLQNGGTGIFINGGSDQYLSNILIYSPSNTPASGIEIRQSGGVWMTNVDSVHNNRGLLIDPQNGQTAEWLFIMNSAFDTSLVHGIDIIPASGGNVFGSTFIGDWSSSSTNVGFYIEPAGSVSGLQIIGHRSFGNGLDGLVISPQTGGNANYVSVKDSYFSGNSATTSNTSNGISVAAGVLNFMLEGNICSPMAGAANTQKYGISVATGSSNGYIITGNFTLNNVTGSIFDGGTGTSKIVTNNL